MAMNLAIELMDSSRLVELLLGLGFNGVAIGSLAFLTFRRSQARATYVFTLVVVNVVVFFVTYLMSAAAVSVNVGFGLFALFGILRFRTGTLPVLEMTYLFAAIAIASFNALAFTSLTVLEAVIANVIVIGVLELLGGRWLSGQPVAHSLLYERIELVPPERRDELRADLEARTGLRIDGIEVEDINFLNDTARITIKSRPTTTADIVTHTEYDVYDR